MPKFKCIQVSLSEVLEVRGEGAGLSEPETWSVLCQAVMALQDIYIIDRSFSNRSLTLITPETLLINNMGVVSFRDDFPDRFQISDDFIAPEKILSFQEKDIEKSDDKFSAILNETLNFMHQLDPDFRHSLASLFEIILRFAKTGTKNKPFSFIVMKMYEEVLGNLKELEQIDDHHEEIEFENDLEEKDITKEFRNETLNSNEKICINGDQGIIDENKKHDNGEEILSNVTIVAKYKNGINTETIESESNGVVEEEEEEDVDIMKIQNNVFNEDTDTIPSDITESDLPKETEPQEILGPEFVIRSCYSNIRLCLNSKTEYSLSSKLVTVISLTGRRYEVEIDMETTNNGEIFHAVAKREKLEEKFLFGLAHLYGGEFLFLDLDCNFFDTTTTSNGRTSHQSNVETCTLYLRVKFYVNSDIIRHSTTKRMHYLQLRKDILEERISCNLQCALLLASLSLRVEYGHRSDLIHDFNLDHYVPQWVLQKSNPESIRKELIRLHCLSDTMISEVARKNYIEQVQSLRDYGFHFHVVHRDKKDPKSAILLGVSLAGISIFAPLNTKNGENKQELQRYLWPNITRITHDKKHFSLTLQSRNLKNHFMKCRFHTKDNFGKYLFNLAFTHHRLHLRLISQLDTSTNNYSQGVYNGANGFLVSMTGDDVPKPNGGDVQESNIPCQTNLTKARRSRSIKDLNFMKWKKKSPKFTLAIKENDETRKKSITIGRNASKSGTKSLTCLFIKSKQNGQTGNNDDQVPNITSPQPYVIDTCFRFEQSDSSIIRCDETISDSLVERFANLTGVESVERRINSMTLIRDEQGRLGITVCEGADGATYVQSIDRRHYLTDIRPGDRLLSINGKYIEVELYETVVELLRNANVVDLVVSQNIDHLDDDVFEPDFNTMPPFSSSSSSCATFDFTTSNNKTTHNKRHGSSDLTYECHDADLRNEITCFIQKHVNTDLCPLSEEEDSSSSSSSEAVTKTGKLSKQNDVLTINGTIKGTESLDGALIESHLLHTETSSIENRNLDRTWAQQRFTKDCSELRFNFEDIKGDSLVSSQCSSRSKNRVITMVTKQDQSSEDAAEFHFQQRHMSSSADDGGVSPDNIDSAGGCSLKTVLWSPRHSGTVLNKICNFEVQSQKGCNQPQQQQQPSPSQHAKPTFGLSQKYIGKSPNLPKCSSLHRLTSEEYNDRMENRQSGGEWCSAVKSRPYRPKNLPQLARSKTMPAVYKDHVVAITPPDTSNTESSDEPTSPSKMLYMSQLKHHNAPWWSKFSLDDDQVKVFTPRKVFSPVNTKVSPQKTTGNVGRASSLLNLSSPPSKKHQSVQGIKSDSSQLLRSCKPRLMSLSTEHIGPSPSLVSIAKERLRKHSTVAEMLPVLPRSASADGPPSSPLSFLVREPPKIIPKQMEPPKSDEKMRQLKVKFPFIKENNVFEVSITKNSRGLGLSICGGRDQDPDDPLMLLIRIKRLYNLHPASDCGQLEIGDVLLMVNGRHVTGLNQSEVVDALRVTSLIVNLVICRPPPGTLPPVPQTGGLANSSALSLSSLNLLGLAGSSFASAHSPVPKEFEVIMEKWNGSLGFTLHKLDGPHSGHYIKALVKDPALTDGRIRPGDQILQVDGTEISSLSHDETINLLRSAPSTVTLLVNRSNEPPPPSPLSPMTPFSAFGNDYNRSRKDKKVLRKEAQDLLFDKERRRSQESGCGSSVSPTNRRHLRKEKTSSNTTGSCKSDATDTYSSASDADSLRTTPIPPPHDNQMVLDCGEYVASKKQLPSPLISLSHSSSEDLSKVSRPTSLNLGGYGSNNSLIPKGLPSLQITKWESDRLDLDSNKTNSSGSNSPKTDNSSLNACSPRGLMKWRGAFLSPVVDPLANPKPCAVEQVFPMTLVVDLDRSWNTRLGFSLLNIDNGHLKGTYVRTIHPGSLAEKDGRLKPGDGLLKVNGQLVKGLTTSTIIEMLRSIRGKVILDIVRDPVVSNKVLATAHTTTSPSQVRKLN